MRIIHTTPAPPVVGATREINKFIIFPKRIGNETRFLERAVYLEEYQYQATLDSGMTVNKWVPVSWFSE